MMTTERPRIEHADGTSMFRNRDDAEREREVAALLESKWRCRICSFGALAVVDFYAVRFDRPIGVLELKCRSHDVGKYPTVFLSVRKWHALAMLSAGMGVPALFVVRFTDGVRFVPLAGIDARRYRMAGSAHGRDLEPVIDVPVDTLDLVVGPFDDPVLP